MFLIFGRTGWIGGLVGQYLKQQGAKFEFANCRLEDRAAVISEIERVGWLLDLSNGMHAARSCMIADCVLMDVQVKPTHVLNAAGLTGRPNVDWCETHRVGVLCGANHGANMLGLVKSTCWHRFCFSNRILSIEKFSLKQHRRSHFRLVCHVRGKLSCMACVAILACQPVQDGQLALSPLFCATA